VGGLGGRNSPPKFFVENAIGKLGLAFDRTESYGGSIMNEVDNGDANTALVVQGIIDFLKLIAVKKLSIS